MRHEREKPLVLLADDDAFMAKLAGAALSAAGIDVVFAVDGNEALEKFTQLRPDAILLDVMMPEVDGFAACRRIRDQKNGVNIPILMMTALDDVASVDCAYECGATDFVTKPVSYTLLAHRVRYLLRSNEAFLNVRASAKNLVRAQRLARLVQWELDVVTQVFSWAEGSRDVFPGLEGTAPVKRALLDWVHPKDRARVEEALAQGTSHRLEYRLVLPSGEERIVY